jgi:iron(III) transport system ATP-binding protein
VLVTHDQDEALSTADRVAVLRDGRIAQCDSPQDLYDRPADADIARFIGEANLIEGVLDRDAVDTILGRLPVEPAVLASPAAPLASGPAALASGPATVLVRPEQVEVLADGQDRRAAEPGELAGRVVAYGYHGHDAVVHVWPELDRDAPTIVVRTLGGHRLPPGSPVTLRARVPFSPGHTPSSARGSILTEHSAHLPATVSTST